MDERRAGRAVALAVAGALALAGCTASGTGTTATEAAGPAASLQSGEGVLAVPAAQDAGYGRVSGSPAAAAVAASRTFFASAQVAVLASDTGDVAPAAERARALGVPLLLVPGQPAPAAGASESGTAEDGATTDEAKADAAKAEAAKKDAAKAQAAVAAELSRLGVRSVEAYAVPDTSFLPGIDVVDPGSTSVPDAAAQDNADQANAAQASTSDAGRAAVVHLKDPGALGAAGLAAVTATAQAAGAEVSELATADPRAEQNRQFFAEREGRLVVAAGDGFGSTADFGSTAATAAAGSELPGGGQLLFPQRRMVALYGHPGTPSLGLLGEQGIEESIARVKKLAAEYQPYSKEPVQPAFEIITTVATGHSGTDGKYSAYTAVDKLKPWIDAAQKAGVYVVLDLQPGRNDFLVQAKKYEELLKRPNVGLALDPEWRLKPNQRHLVQIGSVDAAEINKVSAWLAELVREHALPQKMLILHQFQLRMIRDRDTLETGHPELSLVLHADGNGTPGQKQDTWNALRRDLPPGIRMAWKNFIDEDEPTFSPKRTYSEVDPKPWFVSYQ
ncbi:hypothetical protein [Arthrobacter ginkgonis]